MVAPLIIAAGVSAAATLVSSLVSWSESKDAQSASDAERSKVQALIDKIQSPNFDMSKITPQEYKIVGTYTPEAIPTIEEQYPEIIQKTKDMQEGRSAQMEAIRYMREIASSGKDPIAEMDRIKGARQAAQEANTQSANIQSQMQRRGIGDSALQLGLQQQAAGDAGYQTAMSGEEAARDALNRRMSASQNSANIGGQVFSADEQQEAQNAAIINDFNQRMSARRQQLAELNTNNSNQAQQTNLDNAQKISNSNITAQNNAAVYNQTTANDLKQRQYTNNINKVAVASGQAQSNIAGINENAKANQNLYTGLGGVVSTTANAAGQYYGSQRQPDESLEDYKIRMGYKG